jgi:vacuolar-type H+-ATPase subunit H
LAENWLKNQHSFVNIVQVYFPREGYRLIANDLDKIREIEKLKEKELKESQRQAQQILIENEKLIEQNHTQALVDAEKKAEEIKNRLLKEAEGEVEKILKNYQEDAEVLQKEISQRIPQVVNYLLEKVWQEYGN